MDYFILFFSSLLSRICFLFLYPFGGQLDMTISLLSGPYNLKSNKQSNWRRFTFTGKSDKLSKIIFTIIGMGLFYFDWKNFKRQKALSFKISPFDERLRSYDQNTHQCKFAPACKFTPMCVFLKHRSHGQRYTPVENLHPKYTEVQVVHMNTALEIVCVIKTPYHSKKWNEPLHDKTNTMACVPSEDLDQPGYPVQSDQSLRCALNE